MWYKELKHIDLYYTIVTDDQLLTQLRDRSGSLHAINIINLTTNMIRY